MDPNRNIAEKLLKAATIEHLLDLGHLDQEAVLISEMVAAEGQRRADLVVANGRLCAFEIKSQNDTLRRIDGQVADLMRSFERTVVVADAKFERKLKALLPTGVGLWISTDGTISECRKPRTRNLTKREAVSFLLVSDLRRLLRMSGISASKNSRRQELETKAMKLPRDTISAFAREAVKARHQDRYESFQSERARCGTLVALDAYHYSDPQNSKALEPTDKLAQREIMEAPLLRNDLVHMAPAGAMLMRERRKN